MQVTARGFLFSAIMEIPKAILFSRCSSVSATYDIYTKHGAISQLRCGGFMHIYQFANYAWRALSIAVSLSFCFSSFTNDLKCLHA